MSKFVNLTGLKFGKLTAVQRMGKDKNNNALWVCRCDCGGEKIVPRSSLKNGGTKSCGCLFTFDWTRKEKGYAASLQAYFNVKSRANSRKLEFDLSFEEFLELAKLNCIYCGTEPSNISKAPNNNGDFLYQGIDRIDNNKGYVLENCAPCCRACNIAKNSRSVQEFKEWIKAVYSKKNAGDLVIVYAYVVGDILHRGHIEALKNAKALGDKLIVGVLIDKAVQEKKPQPTIGFEERFDIVRSLSFVDCVVAQKEYSPVNNIRRIKPDVLAESDSHDYPPEFYDAIKQLGIRVISFPYFPGHSSTEIKKKVKEEDNGV